MKIKRSVSSKRGRPRQFDVDQALDRALRVFWSKGYEGTSLEDLTRAMRINRPSLYAAFGNKEALFRKALDRYAQGPAAYVREALEEPTARGVVQRLFRGTIELLTDRRHPRGCLIVQGALSCGEEAECVRKELAGRRITVEGAIRRRFQRAPKGDLPRNCDSADLARYVVTIIRGMCIEAADGATRAQLQRVATMALRAWPHSR